MTTDAGETNRVPGGAATPDCLCMGLGPQLTALLRGLVTPAGVAETLRSTELDVLTFLKVVIEQRLANLSGTPPEPKGTKVVIE